MAVNFSTRGTGRYLGVAMLVALLGGILGCAAKRVVLTPAPNATLAALPNAAEGRSHGVTITVQAEAWNGKPANLDHKVVPLNVTIRNNSGHPLAIRYKDFVLVAADGKTYADIPPSNISGTVYAQLHSPAPSSQSSYLPVSWQHDQGQAPSKPNATQHSDASHPNTVQPDSAHHRIVIVPDFYWSGYYVAPWWGYAYPGIGYWSSPWGPPDWAYYNRYYPYMREIHLPTRSMLRKAIPEGVVANQGTIRGFLYFQKPSDVDQQEPLSFKAQLVNAQDRQRFGTIQIPFTAKQK